MKALRFYTGKKFAAWIYVDHIHTIWWDGSETRGYPLLFADSARHLGYGDDTYWHMIERDLAHNWLPDYLDSIEVEEDQVSALQSALNAQEWGKARMHELFGNDASTILREAYIAFRPNGQTMTKTWAVYQSQLP